MVEGITTLFEILNSGDGLTFHDIYPFKGKFYSGLVRMLLNAFCPDGNSYVIDPFNGSGTTTHEATLMGIKSVGMDILPLGNFVSKLKNDLLFIDLSKFGFRSSDFSYFYDRVRAKDFSALNSIHPVVKDLSVLLYIDSEDTFLRTTRFNKIGKFNFFKSKFEKIIERSRKLQLEKERHGLVFVPASIQMQDILDFDIGGDKKEKFDIAITSPPYFFSVDYVGKDKVFYDFFDVDMKSVSAKYLGMRQAGVADNLVEGKKIVASLGFEQDLSNKIVVYYLDLRKAISNIYNMLKCGGILAIVVGDSTYNKKPLPTTKATKYFANEIGFSLLHEIFNPLLGRQNRAIRGETVLVFLKK